MPVLIIDDNEDIRDYLKDHLEENYRIIEAADGSEGLQKTVEEHPDLVLADIMMPGMDGLSLCRAIKEDERTAHIPVILLTARASEEAEVEGLEFGADDYVCKPFSAEALLARVENMIEIRRFLKHRFSDEVTIQPLGRTVQSSDAQFLEQVKEAIESHMDDSRFTVEWLADEVGISPRQLRRKLRDLINLSPSGYVRMATWSMRLSCLRATPGMFPKWPTESGSTTRGTSHACFGRRSAFPRLITPAATTPVTNRPECRHIGQGDFSNQMSATCAESHAIVWSGCIESSTGINCKTE